jgi:Ran GTPase-activating protein (RanGAP) involved in mRNA processing and transport
MSEAQFDDFLNSCRSVQTVNLQDKRIGNSKAIKIAHFLILNPLVLKIDLSCNDIGDDGASEIADALNSDLCGIRSIHLDENSIRDKGAIAIAQSLGKIEQISLSLNFIGDLGILEIAKALKVNNSIINIALAGLNRERKPKISVLLEALLENSTLSSADLGWNNIGLEGSKILALLLKNHQLKKLLIYFCGIGSEGTIEIARALKSNHALVLLDLGNNNIGPQGAISIADALRGNSTLESLYLYDNQIGDKGAQEIADSLKINSTLQRIFLHRNGIGEFGAEMLAEALVENSSLLEMDLRGNDIKVAQKSFENALETNFTLLELRLYENSNHPFQEIKNNLERNQKIFDQEVRISICRKFFQIFQTFPFLFEFSILRSILYPMTGIKMD